jgi:geranylgeranyl pyrophosphate synthase
MFALAFRAGLAVPDPVQAVDIARRFGDTALLLTEGQYLDMSFETRADVSHEEYLNMIGKKSAALVEFAVWSGARIAGAGEKELQCLSRFGRGLGTAFQIHDDIMGIWGRREVTGKRSRTDLENRKKTLPVLLASEQALGTDAELFHAYLSGEKVDMASLLDALDRLEIRAEAELAVVHQLSGALDALRSAGLSPEHELQFADIAGELTGYGSATSWGIVSNR